MITKTEWIAQAYGPKLEKWWDYALFKTEKEIDQFIGRSAPTNWRKIKRTTTDRIIK